MKESLRYVLPSAKCPVGTGSHVLSNISRLVEGRESRKSDQHRISKS